MTLFDNNDKNDRIKELRRIISEYDYAYYVEHKNVVDDFTYDKLYRELQELEKEFPDCYDPNSPTNRVPSDKVSSFRKITHSERMLSLQNTYSIEEIKEFDRRCKELLAVDQVDYLVELKLDGVSLSCVYQSNRLKYAVTRGDGEVGDDVSLNALQIRNLPKNTKQNNKLLSGDFEVRGEVIMFKKDFAELNQKMLNQGQKTFANPRNLASGTLKLLDPNEVSKRSLQFFAYNLLSTELGNSTLKENLKILQDIGFTIIPSNKLCKNVEEIQQYINEWENKRDELPFYIDGLVIKVNSIQQQHELGTISRFPRWAIAYKYSAEQVETRLIDITFQVGRTGIVSPVAELEPVELAQTIVKRATLHNEDYIKTLDLRVGDYVFIEKGGEIIPKVVGVNFEKRNPNSTPFVFPEFCPCEHKTKLVKYEDEVAYYCVSMDCPWQLRKKIEHFASRNAMNIEGMGERTIDQFVELGFITNITDIYYLYKYADKIAELKGWGKKSVEKLLNGINESKNKPFENVLFALGIRYVGEFVAKVISKEIGSIDKLISMSLAELTSINQIGEKIAKSIKDFLQNNENIEIINILKQNGIKFVNDKSDYSPKSNKLKDLSFLFTGELEKFTRNQAEEIIEQLGGKVVTSVSKKLSYLVVGNNPGSKLKKAQEIGVNIINEDEFIKMIENE